MSDIDAAYPWRKKEFTRKELFSWFRCLASEKEYASLWKKTKDVGLLEKAGFFFDNTTSKEKSNYFSQKNIKKINTPFTPLKSKKDEVFVILMTGSFAPFHEGHLNALKLAEECLIKKGHPLIASYISPSHDVYVSTKDGGSTAPYNAETRIETINDLLGKNPSKITRFVDFWESVGVDKALNFTTVRKRLRLYLEEKYKRSVKVACVFGADNAFFSEVFYDEPECSICIGRGGREKPNVGFFVDANHPASSTQIRKTKLSIKEKIFENKKKIYVLRDEEKWSFTHYKNKEKKEELKKAYRLFCQNIERAIQKAFENEKNFFLLNMPLEEQIKIFPKHENVITVDPCFKKQSKSYFPLSRKFLVSGQQRKTAGFAKRPFERSRRINKEKEFVLCDDDCSTGETIRKARNLLERKGVKISSCYIALDAFVKHKGLNRNDVFDCADLRDFLLGSYHGGLVVSAGNKTYRVPYIFPWVNLVQRMRMPKGKSFQFSLDVLDANAVFFESLSFSVTVDDFFVAQKVFFLDSGFPSRTPAMVLCQQLKHDYLALYR